MAKETELEAYKAVLELIVQECGFMHEMTFETVDLEARLRSASMLKFGIMIENTLAHHAPKEKQEDHS